ncbi:Methionyl-tRNA synthetase [Ectocarpus siliculosus]|uniref:methionine--tRNA ligase n=1 Tax=Ectocarpus siliculosus TaxID=2880 RepID=D8LK94_ECTSI|nr:Methionyl-tRNA synthetase [Ectocarpus siliculosus]|eukprot:CBN79628.1 Methionyl-tRNA synthetase [Ectocarpus siliculosus]
MGYRQLAIAMLSLAHRSSSFVPRALTTGSSRGRARSQAWSRAGTAAAAATAVRTRMSSASSSASSTGHDTKEMPPYYVTTPIYYVNDKPHIGHAYTTLACDVIARFMRLDGREVMFLTGTDEHGQKVEASALKADKSPQQFCDEVSQEFRDLLKTMNFSNDRFIRTTDTSHKVAASALWNRLQERGQISLGVYAGWYSVRDEAFYGEAELVDGKAPSGAEVEWVEKEPSYFFKLSEWQQPLLDFYAENPQFIAPESRRNEAVSFVSGGLRDLSISRTSFSWGVPVPGDDEHVMYVWVDALANYISALGFPEMGEAGEFSKFWPADLHVIGKDILRFHSVYWPALLLAAGLEPPKRLFVHGWWTKDGQKISKSTGNVIDPLDLVARYGVDATRYFLMSEVPFGNDGDFSETAFQNRVNSNLANEVGNLAMRTLSMAVKNCGGQVPRPAAAADAGDVDEGGDKALGREDFDLTPEDKELLKSAGECLGVVRPLVGETQQLHKALEAILLVSRDANRYVDFQAPWKLKKTDPDRMKTVLWVLLETIRHVGILYQPFVPEAAGKLLDQLGVPEGDARLFAALDQGGGGRFSLQPGVPLDKPVPVFPRIEVPEEAVAS